MTEKYLILKQTLWKMGQNGSRMAQNWSISTILLKIQCKKKIQVIQVKIQDLVSRLMTWTYLESRFKS